MNFFSKSSKLLIPFLAALLFFAFATSYLGPYADISWWSKFKFTNVNAANIRYVNVFIAFFLMIVWQRLVPTNFVAVVLWLVSFLPILHGGFSQAGYDLFLLFFVVINLHLFGRKMGLATAALLSASLIFFLMPGVFWSWDTVNIYAAIGLNRVPIDHNIGLVLALATFAVTVFGQKFLKKDDGDIAVSILFISLFSPGILRGLGWLPLPFLCLAYSKNPKYFRPTLLLGLVLFFDSYGTHEFYTVVRDYGNLMPGVLGGWTMPSFLGSTVIKGIALVWITRINRSTPVEGSLPFFDINRIKTFTATQIAAFNSREIVKSKSAWVLVFFCTLTSFFLNFHQLGATSTPVTGVIGDGEVLIRLSKDDRVSGVWVNHLTGQMLVTFECEWGGEWKLLGRDNTLSWVYKKLSMPCKNSVRFKWKKSGNFSQTNEIMLVDQNFKKIRPELVCDTKSGCVVPESHELFDESQRIPTVPFPHNSATLDEYYNAGPGVGLILDKPMERTTSHPYMGRWLIYKSMQLWGVGPFGWRFPSAFCSALLPFLIFLLGRSLFKNDKTAAFAAILSLLDMLRISVGRSAFVDTQVTFFLLIHFLLLIKSIQCKESAKLACFLMFGSWVSLGFAVSTKWSGLFSVLFSLPLTFLAAKRLFVDVKNRIPIAITGLTIVVASMLIYLGPYYPFVSSENTLNNIAMHQLRMLEVHAPAATGVVEDQQYRKAHQYSSGPNDWLFNNSTLRTSSFSNSFLTGAYIFANPALAWALVIALVSLFWRKQRQFNLAVLTLLVTFTLQIVPWILIRRYSFLYHFQAAMTIGALLISEAVWSIDRKWKQYLIGISLLSAAIFCFGFFWPIVFSTPIDALRLSKIVWFKRWFYDSVQY